MASDDGFREIQLNGKQLVFLFMATTIVAVVIFLCGVMVGRGVRGAALSAGAEAAAAAPAGDLTAVPDTQAPGKSAATIAPSTTPPPPPPDDLGSDVRADSGKPADQTPSAAPAPATEKPPADKPGVEKSAANKPIAAAVATAQRPTPQGSAPAPAGGTPPAAVVPSEPPGDGIPVQVGAYVERSQAETVARHLLAQGYTAYIMAPPASGGMFRVRVGKFKERREAEAVLRRLVKEEQFKQAWIPR
jgi:cell division septation protein DedD